MFYEVNGEKFHVKPGQHRTPLEALTAAIRFAKECAVSGAVTVMKVDGDAMSEAYVVDRQPLPKPRSREEGWNE